MAKKGKKIGAEAFESHYRVSLGDSQWEALKDAFQQEPEYHTVQWEPFPPYYLDPASVEAAKALTLKAGDRVLDLCAAPGGKSLILASQLPEGASLTSNEWSRSRRIRLSKVLSEHIPKPLSNQITVSGRDSTKWCLHEQDAYDKILLDAPCSSERHVWNAPSHLQEWSPSRIKRLAQTQYTMLVSALEVVRVGGEIVYSTCSLAEEENDGVLSKLHKKRAGRFEILPVSAPLGKATEWGWKIWPHTCKGQGPIYFSKIRRLV